jgi:hypothetical protein
MDRLLMETRQRILKEELEKLKNEGYISTDVYRSVAEAHAQYYKQLVEVVRQDQMKQQENAEDTSTPLATTPQKAKVVKEKKKLSPQAIRERNITWSLNLGVILLLIGGLVLATSTWDTLVSWEKTGLIALVSLLFFGLAYFTRNVLKIEKTGFAFHVLGSLFLPIVILSAGYFALFGPYFSFYGEGRYLYGAIGCLVIIPVYLLLAIRLASRLFVWFTYITISTFASFVIAALYLPVDGFYLGIMLFNVVLIIAYRYLRAIQWFQPFTREFVVYIQANLILSTLFMLVFYNHELMHSVNLLLTAALYFAMMFVSRQKEYHFVFSIMLVYGAYQLIEFSALHEIGAIVYALLGFAFIVIPMMIPEDTSLTKAFRYTSAIISVLAFFYISLTGLLLRMNEPSLVLLLAYLIISLNFTYLTTVVKQRIFKYLSPVFLIVALYELVLLSQQVFDYHSPHLALFMLALICYIVFGSRMNIAFFRHVKASTRDVTIVVMSLCILIAFVLVDWWQTGTMLLFVSLLAIFIDRLETRKSIAIQPVAAWVHAVALGSAVAAFYAANLEKDWSLAYVEPIKAENFILAGVIVLAVSLLWKWWKRSSFYDSCFYTAQVFYGLGTLFVFTAGVDAVWRTIVVLGGVGMAYMLYRKTTAQWTAYLLSALSLLFYLTILYVVYVHVDVPLALYHQLQFVVGAVLLLAVGTMIGEKDTVLKLGFWWVGHLYLPIALIYSYLLYGADAIWAFAIATFLYGWSMRYVRQEGWLKTYLYATFTSFWVTVYFAMVTLAMTDLLHHSFLITSVVIAVLWYRCNPDWVWRIAYYLVPFSVVGLTAFVRTDPYEWGLFIVTLLYAAGLLYIMHRQKWDIFTVVPLSLVFYAVSGMGQTDTFVLIYFALFGILATVVGYWLYPTIYQEGKGKGSFDVIDWYSTIGLIAFCNLYFLTGDTLWTKLLPGILIVWYGVAQRKRIPYVPKKWVLFAACAYTLQPYYVLLGHFQVPDLIEMDLYVLPWIILTIFLKKVTDPKYKLLANRVQWAVLLVVSLLLVRDGLESNTIYDALIIGGLSLISLLAGMAYQIKSFFFVGAGVLLLNVFLQTRPYWGNLPWWMYLLIAGSILIIVASYNEWHKQKASAGKETLISIFNKKVVQRMKRWN